MERRDFLAQTRLAYADLARIARDMWPVLLILAAMYFVCTMGWFLAPALVGTWIGRFILRMLIFIGVGWITTPYYIALHRFVQTGEVRWIPSRQSYGDASHVYFGWSALVVMMWFTPMIGREVIDAFVPPFGGVFLLVALVALFMILARLTTLLPAAALDPARAGWKQAMDDSRGRAWSFFLQTAGAASPVMIVLVVLGQAAGQRTIEALPFFILAVPSLLALQLIPLAAGTRLYLEAPRGAAIARMNRVLRR